MLKLHNYKVKPKLHHLFFALILQFNKIKRRSSYLPVIDLRFYHLVSTFVSIPQSGIGT